VPAYAPSGVKDADVQMKALREAKERLANSDKAKAFLKKGEKEETQPAGSASS